MSFSPDLSSSFNNTKLRSPGNVNSGSGMCATCISDCPAFCEIGLSSLRGKESVYPVERDKKQFGSEKHYPVDFSHFNINGRVFGASGLMADSDTAHSFNVDLSTEFGTRFPIKQKLPIILPAIAKLNWADYYSGAALAGVTAVIGEAVINEDLEVEFSKGKVISSPLIKEMVLKFKQYDHGYGDIVLQGNYDDVKAGVLEYAVEKLGVKSVEIKLGQAAKGIQAISKIKSAEKAKELQSKGLLVYPDPCSTESGKNLESMLDQTYWLLGRLPMYDEETLAEIINKLKELGAHRVMFKMGGYDKSDLERILLIASENGVDLVTFDSAGGGTGNSPCKMMNEWGLPPVYLENILWDLLNKMHLKGLSVPSIAITGGFSLEDSIFKGLAFGAPFIKLVGVCRPAMAAAMYAKKVGEEIKSQNLNPFSRQYGSTKEEIFNDLFDLQKLMGKNEINKISPGSLGVFSYLNRVAFGLKLFMALNRKFSLRYLDRSDIIPLTSEAKMLLRETWL